MESASVNQKLKDGREERNDRRSERKRKAQEFVSVMKGDEREGSVVLLETVSVGIEGEEEQHSNQNANTAGINDNLSGGHIVINHY